MAAKKRAVKKTKGKKGGKGKNPAKGGDAG